jgi:hypothetical protein
MCPACLAGEEVRARVCVCVSYVDGTCSGADGWSDVVLAVHAGVRVDVARHTGVRTVRCGQRSGTCASCAGCVLCCDVDDDVQAMAGLTECSACAVGTSTLGLKAQTGACLIVCLSLCHQRRCVCARAVCSTCGVGQEAPTTGDATCTPCQARDRGNTHSCLICVRVCVCSRASTTTARYRQRACARRVNRAWCVQARRR